MGIKDLFRKPQNKDTNVSQLLTLTAKVRVAQHPVLPGRCKRTFARMDFGDILNSPNCLKI